MGSPREEVTFLELKTHVRKFTGDRLASNQIQSQDIVLGTLINEIVVPDLVGRHDWFFKQAMETSPLAINTYTFQMPPTLQGIELLILLAGTLSVTGEIIHRQPTTFFANFPDPSLYVKGIPAFYTWVNRQVWLNCPTQAAWNVRMLSLRRFDKLVQDGDIPTWMDDDRHMLLVMGATGLVYQIVEDSKNAAVWLKLYEQGVEAWWLNTPGKSDENVALGRFDPTEQTRRMIGRLGQYWTDPRVMHNP